MCGPQHIRHQSWDRPMLRFSVRCKCAAHNMPKNIVFPSANYRSNVIYIQKRIIAERRPTTTIVKLFLKRFNANREMLYVKRLKHACRESRGTCTRAQRKPGHLSRALRKATLSPRPPRGTYIDPDPRRWAEHRPIWLSESFLHYGLCDSDDTVNRQSAGM